MTTLVLQPDETSGVDTYLDNGETTTNYGTEVRISAGEDNTVARIYRTLIKFDLSSIPSNATITSATLSLTIELDRSSNARDFKLYRVLRDWVEAQATWNIWKTSNNWSTAGCGSDGNDADLTTAWATTNFSATETGVKSFSINTTEFTKFINGTYSNYGWLIKADTESDDAYTFHSSSAGTAGNRPYLTVVYEANNGFFF